jgi:general L-amino acid transport system permease protein
MATLYHNVRAVLRGEAADHFSLGHYLREHLLARPWLLLWLLLLTYITVRVVMSQLADAPLTTLVVLLVWGVSVVATAAAELTRRHSPATLWLSHNLYNSLPNALLTLLLVLVLLGLGQGFFGWAVTRASFTTDPDAAKAQLAAHEEPGANWGAVGDNFRNLMVFRFPREEDWRLWTLLAWLAVLAAASGFVYGRAVFRRSPLRRGLTLLWLLTPVLSFVLLVGLGGEGSFLPRLNPDIAWGGLLLTLIIAVFGILASFPLGLVLALGRRSRVQGVPAWLVWAASLALLAWLLVTQSLPGLRAATTTGGRIVALWPLLLLPAALLITRAFRGNLVALLSTAYIEVIRGVPLITILFMSIIIFPFLLPPGMEILGTWRVMAAVALFSAAYLAENVRGGLQSIPRGQYEAADALGLSTFAKYRIIILPQALRAVIPAIVGQFIALDKDTTLVGIVALIELLGVANLISAQPDWLSVRREPYVFIALIYFTINMLMATYSRRLERQLGVGER